MGSVVIKQWYWVDKKENRIWLLSLFPNGSGHTYRFYRQGVSVDDSIAIAKNMSHPHTPRQHDRRYVEDPSIDDEFLSALLIVKAHPDEG